MLIILLCILISPILNFEGLTLIELMKWFNNHPFLLLLSIMEILKTNINIIKFNSAE